MRVLLAHKFWKKVGGAEAYFQDVIRILESNGHEVMAYSTIFDPGGGKDIFKVNDQKVKLGHYVDYLNGNIIKRFGRIPATIYNKKNKEEFRQLLREFKPDIVHVFAIYVTITPSILEVCKEEGVPVVMSCNDYKHLCPNYRLFHHGHICEDCKGGRFYMAILNNCCKHSIGVSIASAVESYYHDYKDIFRKNVKTFLFESEFMLNKTREFWDGKEFNTAFLGKPFDATAIKASGVYGDYILYMGRLSDEKGVDILIKAMQLVPSAKLKIAGDGNYMSRLKQLAKELGCDNVEFLGMVVGDELKKTISESLCVVVPSLWYENFPYVMTEAFAMGKAVIGSDKGGIPEYIKHGKNGFVYHSNNVNELSECIRSICSDASVPVSMGAEAKSMADEMFNDPVFYNRLIKIYQDAIRLD